MKVTQTKRSILDPKPVEEGFMVGKYTDPLCYAAVPIAGSNTKLAIIHRGQILQRVSQSSISNKLYQQT